MYYQWAVYAGMHASAYQLKDGVDDIETIYLKVYRIKYILRSVSIDQILWKNINYNLPNSAF